MRDSFLCLSVTIMLATTFNSHAARFEVGSNKQYKTITSALEQMRDGDICVVSEGVYRESIEINRSNITLVGQGSVVISGCDVVRSLQPCKVNGMPALRVHIGTSVYDLFCNDQYLMPARFPDKTAAMTSNTDSEESFITPEGRVSFGVNFPADLKTLNDGYYVGLHGSYKAKHGLLSSWYSLTIPITGVVTGGVIVVDEKQASSGFLGKYGTGSGLGYIIGAKAALSTAGEWYAADGELLVVPLSGAQNSYEARTRLYGAVINGSDVRLENIRFKAASMRVEGSGATLSGCLFEYISPFQHNPNDVPANKRGQSMVSCWGDPRNGTAGVYVQGDHFTAKNCRFSKSWWCGMMLRGSHALIEDCVFEDMNWIAKRCAGLFCWGDHNIVRYCTLRNLGGAGIEGGNANWINQYAKNNIWEYNYIEDVCKMIVDQGFFYVNQQSGSNPRADSVWRFNVGKGSRGPVKGEWTKTTVGFYIDNSSSGYRVHNNIAIDANEAVRYNDTRDGVHAGKDILYHNNTFYNCSAIGFGCWTPGAKAKFDAEVMLVNNLSILDSALDFDQWGVRMGWHNNLQSMPASICRDVAAIDFTPVDARVSQGGKAVRDEKIDYIGAVDPRREMWQYGARAVKD